MGNALKQVLTKRSIREQLKEEFTSRREPKEISQKRGSI